MRLLWIISAFVVGSLLSNCDTSISSRQVHTPQATVLMPKIVNAVQERHYKPRSLDDALSKDMFEYFIKQLDPQKEFFTQKDINRLKNYQLNLDEAIIANDFEFFDMAISLLENGMVLAEKTTTQLLAKSPDFSIKENLEVNFSKLNYAANKKDLKDRWRKKLKKYLLDQMYVEEKNDPAISAEDLFAFANKKVKKLLDIKFDKLKAIKDNQRVEEYANAFLKVHDYQSQYFSPNEKSVWDDKFTRSFVGIGVRLEIENGYPKVIESIVGGPAWKSKSILTDDVILKIKEPKSETVDLMGKSLDEVISLIKGPIGAKVQLTIKKKDGLKEVVTLTRNKIEFDIAMSFLLNDDKSKQKIGYIRLPRFYAGDPGSAAHVLSEIETLKTNQVEGIIFDVRNNQGGSGGMCRDIIGYFLEDGIYMQTKRSDKEVNQSGDNDPSVQYDGKLVVLTNAKSGSASELFSGTLQDYKRALIVGGESTFGKGSMQNFVDLNENQSNSFGEVKMSVGLFYTATGRSPQSTGIIPDIKLSDDYKYIASGERAQPFSMAADSLAKSKVSQKINVVKNIAVLEAKSRARTDANKRFQLAEAKAKQLMKSEESQLVKLDWTGFKKQKDSSANLQAQWQEIYADIEGFEVSFDRAALFKDSASILNRERWMNQIKSDPYIYECYQIINDMEG